MRQSRRQGCLLYIDLELCDEAGAVVTDENWKVELEVAGGAIAAGFGSGNPKPAYNYNEGMADAYNGRVQIILKRNGSGQPITVKVKAENGVQ